MAAIARINGRTLGLAEATVPALDHGFLYGNGLFETMRATNGRPFAREAHLDRLRGAGEVIGLPVPPAEALAYEIAEALCDAGEPDAYVRLTVSRGPGSPAPDPSTCESPTVMVVVKPFPAPPERWATEGMRAVTATIRRNASSPMTRVKSLNYMECILAKQAARAAGADEAVFLDTDGNLAETTAWNLFVVADGCLLTPAESLPILPGITRRIVIELAQEIGVPAEEGTYPADRLRTAEEAFLTNSLYGVIALTSLDATPIGAAAPGPLTARLAEAYEALRRRECEA